VANIRGFSTRGIDLLQVCRSRRIALYFTIRKDPRAGRCAIITDACRHDDGYLMRVFRLFAAAMAAASLLTPVPLTAADQPPVRPVLSGAWSMDKTLSTAPGSVAMPDDDSDGPAGRGGRGPGGGGFGGMGGGRRGGMGGGRGGDGGGMRRREGDMAARRALLEELMTLPPKFTIAQDGDKVVFIEPDGVVRTYVANDKAEKHQLQNGTIETKSRWDADTLEMELKPSDGLTITRRYAVRGTPRQLEVTTTTNRGPKNAKRIAVYAVTDDPQPAR
jgi:hypothetical protein